MVPSNGSVILRLALAGISIGCVPSLLCSQSREQAVRPSAQLDPQNLLIQSYLAAKDLGPRDRASFLIRLCRVAADIEPALARLWSEELFQLSFELPMDHDRVATQKNALSSLSLVDAERALELFPSIDDPVPVEVGVIIEDVRAHGAQTILAQYWKQNGRAGLEKIRGAAVHVGQTGEYPYKAMLPIIRELAAIDLNVAQELFDEAVSYFRKDSRIYGQEFRFVEFLKSAKEFIAKPSLRAAMHLMVSRLPQDTIKHTGESFVAKVYHAGGFEEMRNVGDVALLELLPLIREIDLKWVDEILESRPALAAVLAKGTPSRIERGVVRGRGTPEQFAASERLAIQGFRLGTIQSMAAQDPDEALRLTLTLADPELQTLALAAVAQSLARTSPERALGLFQSMLKAVANFRDNSAKVEVLTALARTAAALDKRSEARSALVDGLDLGLEILRRDLDAHPGMPLRLTSTFDSLHELTELGMELDHEGTVRRVWSLQDKGLRAHLLLVVAQALKRSTRPLANTRPHADLFVGMPIPTVRTHAASFPQ